MHISHEEPTNANDPNRGMNTRVYLIVIASAALVALFVGLVFIFAVDHKHSGAPEPTPAAHPSSHLLSPLRPKPSPLHTAIVRTSAKSAPLL
jgi:hypothetical protein